MAAAAICWPARATERDSDCGYRGLQPSAPQRRKGVLILVMRPVNTAFMYMGERANPSVHSTLTSHLKGHLIHTNDLVNNRMKEKWGCGGGLKRDTYWRIRMQHAHVNTYTMFTLRVCFFFHLSWIQLLFLLLFHHYHFLCLPLQVCNFLLTLSFPHSLYLLL